MLFGFFKNSTVGTYRDVRQIARAFRIDPFGSITYFMITTVMSISFIVFVVALAMFVAGNGYGVQLELISEIGLVNTLSSIGSIISTETPRVFFTWITAYICAALLLVSIICMCIMHINTVITPSLILWRGRQRFLITRWLYTAFLTFVVLPALLWFIVNQKY